MEVDGLLRHGLHVILDWIIELLHGVSIFVPQPLWV